MPWTDPVKKREYVRRYAQKYRSDPKHVRMSADRDRKYRYGILPHEYDSLILSSVGRCCLCLGIPLNKFGSDLVLDHCHKKKHWRGVICSTCNKFLGHIESRGLESGWFERAQQYLRGDL